jgi:sigma-B regulation protein RsbQ
MGVKHRNNVNVMGDGPPRLFFPHGFGCDQTMWRYLSGLFVNHLRVVA